MHALKSVDELGKGISKLMQLAELKICFFECAGLASVGAHGKGISQLRQLTELEIDLACFALTSVDKLGVTWFTSVDKLGKGISQLKHSRS